MNDEQLQFTLSQYVDGTLSPLAVVALEAHLANDADSRALLAEYRALDAVVAAAIEPPPVVDYAKLCARIAQALDEAPVPESSTVKLSWWGWPTKMALAAGVLLFGFLWLNMLLGPTGGAPGVVTVPTPPLAAAITHIQVMPVEPATGPAIARITIGPAPQVAHLPALAHYDDWASARPSQVLIAASQGQAHESVLPY